MEEGALTFNLENSRSWGYGVPVGFFAGFSFIPPLGRQPHGPSPSGLFDFFDFIQWKPTDTWPQD